MTHAPRHGFSLVEIAIAMAILSIGILTLALFLPMALRAYADARFKVYAGSKALELVTNNATTVIFGDDGGPKGGTMLSPETDIWVNHPAGTVPSDQRHRVPARNVYEVLDGGPWDIQVGYRSFAPDLEAKLVSPRYGIFPLPRDIAYRLDSPNDEIRRLLDEGGNLYYSSPFATTGIRPDANLEARVPNEAGRLVFAVSGHAQSNALPWLPYKAWPYREQYPAPPITGVARNSYIVTWEAWNDTDLAYLTEHDFAHVRYSPYTSHDTTPTTQTILVDYDGISRSGWHNYNGRSGHDDNGAATNGGLMSVVNCPIGGRWNDNRSESETGGRNLSPAIAAKAYFMLAWWYAQRQCLPQNAGDWAFYTQVWKPFVNGRAGQLEIDRLFAAAKQASSPREREVRLEQLGRRVRALRLLAHAALVMTKHYGLDPQPERLPKLVPMPIQGGDASGNYVSWQRMWMPWDPLKPSLRQGVPIPGDDQQFGVLRRDDAGELVPSGSWYAYQRDLNNQNDLEWMRGVRWPAANLARPSATYVIPSSGSATFAPLAPTFLPMTLRQVLELDGDPNTWRARTYNQSTVSGLSEFGVTCSSSRMVLPDKRNDWIAFNAYKTDAVVGGTSRFGALPDLATAGGDSIYNHLPQPPGDVSFPQASGTTYYLRRAGSNQFLRNHVLVNTGDPALPGTDPRYNYLRTHGYSATAGGFATIDYDGNIKLSSYPSADNLYPSAYDGDDLYADEVGVGDIRDHFWLTADMVQNYHETCLKLATRWSAEYPYDWTNPVPTNRNLMTDHPLIQWDLVERPAVADPLADVLGFAAAQIGNADPALAIQANPMTGRIWGFDGDPRLASADPAAGQARQWRPVAAQDISNMGCNERSSKLDWHGIKGDQRHFSLTRPFSPMDRTRQLVFWQVDWQGYIDCETAPSAPVDASRFPFARRDLNRNPKTPLTNKMSVSNVFDALQPFFRNPEKSVTFFRPVNEIPEEWLNAQDIAGNDFIRTKPVIVQATGATIYPMTNSYDNYHDLSQTSSAIYQHNYSSPKQDLGYNPYHNAGVAGYNGIMMDGRPPENPRATFSGLWGADRNGNRLLDRGQIPASVRMKAVEVLRVNYYDPRLVMTVR